MSAMGFSLNNLSLFGLVLAIGIVVDDAIVVVENVERNIALGLAPREATYKAMDEVSGPVIAVALVLCAVFVPTAFVSGITDNCDCRIKGRSLNFGLYRIDARGTDAFKGFTGLRSTATHCGSSAEGSGYAAFATSAIPTTHLPVPE
jgi:hypothetical protein